MNYLSLKFLACIRCLALIVALPVLAQLPNRDLTVEFRQVAQVDDSTGFSVSTKSRDALQTEQIVRVRNGENATFSIMKSMPMQWVQSISTQTALLTTSGASASSAGGGVTNAVVWMQAGQTLKVKPRWPGGKQLATVDIEVQSASVKDRTGTELPDQSRNLVATTISLPLGKWATFASSGSSPQSGVYSSEAISNGRRLLQIRVMAP